MNNIKLRPDIAKTKNLVIPNQSLKKGRVSQSDIPAFSLGKALRVPEALANSYALKPATPLMLAQAMNMSPGSSGFRMLCGAAIAYGLTDGGCFADSVAITDLGKRIVSPTDENDDLRAKRAAVLKPKILCDFLNKYDGFKLPKEQIAHNVLHDLGVPRDSAAKVYSIIVESAKDVGFLTEIKGEKYVNLKPMNLNASSKIYDEEISTDQESNVEAPSSSGGLTIVKPTKGAANKVFVAHGFNSALVPQLKELLKFGGFEAVISVENETVSQPVPDKVMSDMRGCSAAILHVSAEKRLMNNEGQVEVALSGNVLIEIGAAMAFFGRRFILLVQSGIKLPSNLQGLYEVRYEGEKLDADSTLKLLKAFNDFKNYN